MANDRAVAVSHAAENEHVDKASSDSSFEPRKQRATLVDVLAKAGVASQEDLRIAVAEGLGTGERLGEVALRRGWIDEEALARAYASQWDEAFLEEGQIELDPRAASLLPPDVARRLGAYAIGFRDDVPEVVVAEPAESRFAEVSETLGRDVFFAVVTRAALERLLDDAAALSQQAEVAAPPAEASPFPVKAGDPEAVFAEIDRALAILTSLRERVEPLVRLQRTTADELTEYRERIALLEDEHASDQSARRRLEEELVQQRELFGAAKGKLDEISRTLDVS